MEQFISRTCLTTNPSSSPIPLPSSLSLLACVDRMGEQVIQEALLEYVGKICPIILGAEDLEGKKVVASSDAELAVVSKFINDSNQDVLTVQLLSSPEQHFKFSTDVVNTEFPTVGLVKKAHGNLEQERSIASQVQIVTLIAPTHQSDTSSEEAASAKSKKAATAQDSRTVCFDMMRGYLLQIFDPIVRSLAKGSSQTSTNEGLLNLSKKIIELDVTFAQCQHNFRVPDVILTPHPSIKDEAERCKTAGKRLGLDALGLEHKTKDKEFLDALQRHLQGWMKEVQKITRLVREPLRGTALQEVNFWRSIDIALQSIQAQLRQPEISLIFPLLRAGNRGYVEMVFPNESGLKVAQDTVENVMLLMGRFPIDSLLAALDFSAMKKATKQIFSHLKKIHGTEHYGYTRAMAFVEAMSRDVSTKAGSLLNGIGKLSFDQFKALIQVRRQQFWDEK